MTNAIRFAFALTLLMGAALAWAQNGTVQLNAFPNILVGDGRSTTTLSAEVRDSTGRLVPDGTQVVFESTLGDLRETLVTTNSGLAQVILRAPGAPGVAKVRASALRYAASTSMEIEFVESRDVLDQQQDFVEVVSKGAQFYAFQEKVLEAAAKDQGVSVKYRDIEIIADDIQLNVPIYELRARNGVLKTKNYTIPFRRLQLTLNRMRGVVEATQEVTRYRWRQSGRLAIVTPFEGRITQYLRLNRQEAVPLEEDLLMGTFDFVEVVDSLTKIHATKVIAFPAREIQFVNADVKIQELSVLRFPLYRINVYDNNPIVTEQYVTVSNNAFQVDYPHYLSLAPGRSSALRFRYGERYSTGVGGAGGTFLDYEMSWNEGSRTQGGLTFSGLGRNDWGFHMRQSLRPTENTSVQAQLSFPAHRSMVANTNLTHTFEGVQVSLATNYNETLRGIKSRTFTSSLVAELDPVSWGNMPFRTYLGVSADYTEFSGAFNRVTNTQGLRVRTLSKPLNVGSGSSLTLAHQARYLANSNTSTPLTNTFTMNLSSRLNSSLSVNTGYEYGDDAFTRTALGRHRLTLDGLYQSGAFSTNAYLSRSLDIDRYTFSGNASYRLGPLWNTYFNWFQDRFIGQSYEDQSLVLSYQLGFREVGLSYSWRTRRLGLELLGTRFR